jgi:hypothetical protein
MGTFPRQNGLPHASPTYYAPTVEGLSRTEDGSVNLTVPTRVALAALMVLARMVIRLVVAAIL